MEFTKEHLTKIATEIQKTLRDADRIVFRWGTGEADISDDERVVKSLLDKAFAQTMLLLDAAGLGNTLKSVRALDQRAKKDYTETAFYEDLFLVWTGKLEQYIEPFLPDVRSTGAKEQALSAVQEICEEFHSAARVLANRRRNRTALDIQDEYDVQDLLEALLRVRFRDVRPEEPNPSVAGQSTRVDFFLKQEGLIVESKMAKSNFRDADIGNDLILDVARYQVRSDYDTLVCFIYDPHFLVKNPTGLAADVEGQSSRLSIKVLFGPPRGRGARARLKS